MSIKNKKTWGRTGAQTKCVTNKRGTETAVIARFTASGNVSLRNVVEIPAVTAGGSSSSRGIKKQKPKTSRFKGERLGSKP